MLKHILTIVAILCFVNFLNAQKWVADTITIQFGCPDSIEFNVGIAEISDFRKQPDKTVSVYEKKKWLFFPVDQIIQLDNPLSKSFHKKFDNQTVESKKFHVGLHEFYITNSESSRKRDLTLYSTISLWDSGITDSLPTGTLYYEYAYNGNKKEPVPLAYENLLCAWGKAFNRDLISVSQGLDQLVEGSLYHFRRSKQPVKRNLYVETDIFAGLRFWGADAVLWFSEPEGNRIFTRNARIIRYVNHPDFHSIAFGSNVRMWNYRINEKWLFTNKIALLMGINNWKDMDTVAHKLEEIFYFNTSFSQRLNYNDLDSKGFVFGFGLMQDFHYVIYHNPKFRLAATLNLAYKF